MAGLGPTGAGAAGMGAAGAAAPATGGMSLLLPLLTTGLGMMGGGGKSAPPPPTQFPSLQHSEGQMAPPVTIPSVGNAGPLSAGVSTMTGLNPQLMRLIQMLQGGGGPSGMA